MDVDPRQAVGVLRHNARNQRNTEQKQLVSDSRGKNRVQAGISADDLVLVIGSRIAVVECLYVGFDIFTDFRYLFKKVKGDPLGHPNNLLILRVLILGSVFQHDRSLLDKVVDNILDQNRNAVFDRVGAVIAVAVISGIYNDFQLFENVDNNISVGISKHLDFVDHSALAVVSHKFIGQIGYFGLYVSHRKFSFLIHPS